MVSAFPRLLFKFPTLFLEGKPSLGSRFEQEVDAPVGGWSLTLPGVLRAPASLPRFKSPAPFLLSPALRIYHLAFSIQHFPKAVTMPIICKSSSYISLYFAKKIKPMV